VLLKQSEWTNNATIQNPYKVWNIKINQYVRGLYVSNVAFIFLLHIERLWASYLYINITFCKLKYVCFATQIPRVSSSSLWRTNIWFYMQRCSRAMTAEICFMRNQLWYLRFVFIVICGIILTMHSATRFIRKNVTGDLQIYSSVHFSSNMLQYTCLEQIWEMHCAWDIRTCCRNKRKGRNSSARHCVAVPREAPSVVQVTSVHSRSLRCRIQWRQQGLTALTGPDLLARLLVGLSYFLLHRVHRM
jgi:hypothetical protein